MSDDLYNLCHASADLTAALHVALASTGRERLAELQEVRRRIRAMEKLVETVVVETEKGL